MAKIRKKDRKQLRRQMIRLKSPLREHLQKVILQVADAYLSEEEQKLEVAARLEIYSKRIEEALKSAQLNIDGEELPPKEQREHLVSLDLSSEILIVSQRVWDRLVRELSSTPSRLKTIGRRTFEQLVAFLFEGFGYEVELTRKTRDGGRDIIAVRKAEVYTKHIIECKRPDPGHVVGIRPVRELYGVKSDEGASKAILATTTYFSKDAQLFMERNRWELELRDYQGVLDWISRYLRND